jgi:hypothetical protein
MGIDVQGDANNTLLDVSLTVDITYEPNVRDGEEPIPVNGVVEVYIYIYIGNLCVHLLLHI